MYRHFHSDLIVRVYIYIVFIRDACLWCAFNCTNAHIVYIHFNRDSRITHHKSRKSQNIPVASECVCVISTYDGIIYIVIAYTHHKRNSSIVGKANAAYIFYTPRLCCMSIILCCGSMRFTRNFISIWKQMYFQCYWICADTHNIGLRLFYYLRDTRNTCIYNNWIWCENWSLNIPQQHNRFKFFFCNACQSI